MLYRLIPVCLVLTGVARADQPAADPKPVEFRLTFDQAALDRPFTGRVFVLLTKAEPTRLPRGLNWFNPEPAYAKDVKNWQPGEPLTVGADALAFPTPLAELKPGKYFAQAVMDRDLGGISFAASLGNVYSKPVPFAVGPKQPDAVLLNLDQVYQEPPFKETETVKLAEVESKLLTKFHGKPMTLRAGVILPPSFAREPDRKYPVVYEITGFGGDHTAAAAIAARKPWNVAGTEMIWVVLDANCRLGHHVFADSANNGPVGTALVEELIPHVEKTYRGIGEAGARFVTGHSSGGWSSLWLQVEYPDTFGGCWSTSPDPVDFRDFQRVNVYAPGTNLFTDTDGKPRALSRPVGGRALDFRRFSDMEVLMGRGGQLGSFEAVFSPKGSDGKPRQLWDRKTGAIDPAVAKAWEKYDVRKKLEREWDDVGSRLAGKLHVYMGDEDTFHLDGATRLLRRSLESLGSDAVVEMFPGKTHALVDAKLRERMNREMADAYRNWLKAQGGAPARPR
jgi:S-formylglutathione hydrolase FrmB